MTGYHRSVWWWMSVTCGALAVGVAIAVLVVGTSAPASVQLSGSLPGTGAARSYDIVVSAPGSGGSGDTGGKGDLSSRLGTLGVQQPGQPVVNERGQQQNGNEQRLAPAVECPARDKTPQSRAS